MRRILFLLLVVFMGCPPFEPSDDDHSVDWSVLEGEFLEGSWNAYVDSNGTAFPVDNPTEGIVVALEESEESVSVTMPSFSSASMSGMTVPSITYTGIQVAMKGDDFVLSREGYTFEMTVDQGETGAEKKSVTLSQFKGSLENGKLSVEMTFKYGNMPFPFVCHYTECTLEDLVGEMGYSFGGHTLAFLSANAGASPRQLAFSGDYSMKMGAVNQEGTYTAAKVDNKGNLYNCVFTAAVEGDATQHAMNWQIEIRSAAEFYLYAVTEQMVYSTTATDATGGVAVEETPYTMKTITNDKGYTFTTSGGSAHTLKITESTAGENGSFTGKASYGFGQFNTEGEYTATAVADSNPVAYECVFFGSTYYKVEIISGTAIKLYSGSKVYVRSEGATGTLAQRNEN